MAATSANPTVAAITVSFGSDRVLPALIDSLRAASREPVQVIVVDNRPLPAVEAIARSAHASYLPLPDNPGYGGAVNAGARLAQDSVEWFLIVNPDVTLEPHAIDALLERVDADPTIGAVGPAILTPGGDIYPSARRVPSLRTGVGHALFANAWPRNPWSRQYRQDGESVARDAGWLSGACLLVRRTAFDDVHGFDEGYFMYFEDVDLGMRLARAGWRNRYEPTARVVHTGAHATVSAQSAMLDAHHASANRFLAKKYPGPVWLPVRLVLRAGLAVRSRVTRVRSRV